MHIKYFTKELELLNKRIFFSKEHKVIEITLQKTEEIIPYPLIIS